MLIDETRRGAKLGRSEGQVGQGFRAHSHEGRESGGALVRVDLATAQLDRQRGRKFRRHLLADRKFVGFAVAEPTLDTGRRSFAGQSGDENRRVEVIDQ